MKSSTTRSTISNPPSVLNRLGWFHLALLAILGMFAAPSAFAQFGGDPSVTQTNNNAANNSSFNQLTGWNSGAAPAAGTNYYTAVQMRSPVSAPGGSYLTGNQVFGGDSLTLNTNGFVQGKANVTLNFANSNSHNTGLFLNGGGVYSANNDSGLGVNILAITGPVTANAGTTSYLGGLGTSGGTAYEVLDMQSAIGGSGNLIIGGPSAGNANDTGQLSGVAQFDAANTISGTVSVLIPAGNANSGVSSATLGLLNLNNLNALQNATLVMGGGGGLTNLVSFASAVNSGTFNVGALSGSGNLALTDTAGAAVALSVGANNGSTTYSGNLRGLGSLTKVGTGTMILSGVNSHSGGTTVSGGTLQLDGSLTGAGAVAVNALGHLTGVGSINGATTINGELAPGDAGAIGTLTFHNSLSLLGTLTLAINHTGDQASLVNALGQTVTLGGILDVNNLGTQSSLVGGDSFTLLEGNLTGSFSTVNLPTLDSQWTWDTSQLGTSGIIDVIAVPEPTTLALAGLGGAALLVLRRKKA